MHQYNLYMLTFRFWLSLNLFPLHRPVNQLSLLPTDGLEKSLPLQLCVCQVWSLSSCKRNTKRNEISTLNEGQKGMEGYKNYSVTKLEQTSFSIDHRHLYLLHWLLKGILSPFFKNIHLVMTHLSWSTSSITSLLLVNFPLYQLWQLFHHPAIAWPLSCMLY